MSARDKRVGKMSIPLQEETSERQFCIIDFGGKIVFFPYVNICFINAIHLKPWNPPFFRLRYFTESVRLKQIVLYIGPKGTRDHLVNMWTVQKNRSPKQKMEHIWEAANRGLNMWFMWGSIEISKCLIEWGISKNGHDAGFLSDIWKMRVDAFQADV